MYSDRDRYTGRREEAALRKSFRRRLRLKRFIAGLTLVIMAALACLLLFLLGRGIYSLFGSIKESSEYVKEPPGVQLELVDNVYTDEELYELFGIVKTDNRQGYAGSGTDGSPTPETKDPDIPAKSEGMTGGLIVIDAGHGGMDSGTYNGDILEKDINLSIALKTRDLLKEAGYEVLMTRDDDTYIGLQKRADIANEANDTTGVLAMVSIHQNASDEDRDRIYGVEVWTYDRTGCGMLAELVSSHVCEQTGAKNRGFGYKTNLVVTSRTTMPSVLVECGFLSNEEECGKLTSSDYQEKIARGILDAVNEFINTYY